MRELRREAWAAVKCSELERRKARMLQLLDDIERRMARGGNKLQVRHWTLTKKTLQDNISKIDLEINKYD